VQSHLHGGGYQTGAGNRLLSDGTFDYSYDGEGNLVQRRDRASGAERDLQYDHRNRLVAVIDRDGSGTEVQRVGMAYDALNRRISRQVTTATDDVITHFAYDRANVTLEFIDPDAQGPQPASIGQRYLHGPDVDQVLAQEGSGGQNQWLLADHLGTIRDVVHQNTGQTQHLLYDSFGQPLTQVLTVRFRFTGREFDEQTGLHYFRARYYDATVGRFTSEDPLGFDAGDQNLYRYVENAVTTATDPDGTQSVFQKIRQFFRDWHERLEKSAFQRRYGRTSCFAVTSVRG
jgi:RHS repeat-associated protein